MDLESPPPSQKNLHPGSLTQPLRNGGWKTILSYWGSVTFQGQTVKLREGKFSGHTQKSMFPKLVGGPQIIHLKIGFGHGFGNHFHHPFWGYPP